MKFNKNYRSGEWAVMEKSNVMMLRSVVVILLVGLLNSCVTTGAPNSLVPVMVGPVSRIGDGNEGKVEPTDKKYVIDESNSFWLYTFLGFGTFSNGELDTEAIALQGNDKPEDKKLRIDNIDVRSWFSFTLLFNTYKAETFTKMFIEGK